MALDEVMMFRDGSEVEKKLAENQTAAETKSPVGRFRHVLCVYPYRRTSSSLTAFPPLGLEYVAAALRPYTQKSSW